jgi:Holliday junction resolvase RusA-like endonuclease
MIKEKRYLFFTTVLFMLLQACSVGYSFKDVSIPVDIKTVKINFVENKARYVNPLLSPQLTDALQRKIVTQTKLTRTNEDDAHYIISASVTTYDFSTVAIVQNQSAGNRLTVGVHIKLLDQVHNKTDEYDVSQNFDFPASLSINEAEQNQADNIIKNVTDAIFNRIFSNW